jgi:hypothetical protein
LEMAERRQHLAKQAELLRQRHHESPAEVERVASEQGAQTAPGGAEPAGFSTPLPPRPPPLAPIRRRRRHFPAPSPPCCGPATRSRRTTSPRSRR